MIWPISYGEFLYHLLIRSYKNETKVDLIEIWKGEFVAAPAEDAIVVGETVFFEVYNPNPVAGMSFFVKDCTVSDDEGRSHDIISDNCADRATASSYYTDKGMRFLKQTCSSLVLWPSSSDSGPSRTSWLKDYVGPCLFKTPNSCYWSISPFIHCIHLYWKWWCRNNTFINM